jgi:hypothetical protein
MATITIELPDDVAPEQVARAAEIMIETIRKLQSEGFLYDQIAQMLGLFGAQLEELDEGQDPLATLRLKALDTTLGALGIDRTGAAGVEVELVGGNEPAAGSLASAIIEAIEEHPDIKALERTNKRLDAMDPFTASYADLLEHVPPALQVLSAAFAAAKAACEEAGVSMIEDRDAWRLCAADEELDRENELVFLDDLYPLHAHTLQRMSERIIQLAAVAHNRTVIDHLQELFGILNLPQSWRFEKELAEAMEHEAIYPHAREVFVSVGPLKQIWVSEVASILHIPRFLLDAWIDEAVSEGLIQKVKRGYRWALIPA